MTSMNCNQSVSSTYSMSSNCSLAGDFLRKHHYPLRVCFIGEVTWDVILAAKVFNLDVVTSETGSEFIGDDQTLLVFSSFESKAFDDILPLNLKGRIMGAPALVEAAEKQFKLPLQARPILSLTMKDVIVCFTGIRERSEAMELMYMIRTMGGSVREEPGRWLTHLIAAKTTGPKYDYANTFNVPAMAPEWVRQCWKRRYVPGIHATDDELMAYRQKPFIDCQAAFLGFLANEEIIAMREFVSNGGELSHPLDSNCTHLIIDDESKCRVPDRLPPKIQVVRSEWLWTCVRQIMRAPEDAYLISIESLQKKKPEYRKRQLQSSCACTSEDKENANCCKSKLNHAGFLCSSEASSSSSEYGATPAKVKRIEPYISGIQTLEVTPQEDPDRGEESDLQSAHFSPIQSAQKYSVSSSGSEAARTNSPSPDIKSSTRRSASFLELLQTEENYVNILDTILGIKEEALSMEQPGGALLTETEATVIFSTVTPICEVHRTILRDLRTVQRLWNQSPSIGHIYTEISSELVKVYPPFVNNFEDAKVMLAECEEKKPRFHAFTKIIRGRPECGRQTLPDLMIRPVQRLGSTVLLLREIKKNTPSSHPDYEKLQSALDSLAQVLSVVNEDKRKMETLCSVFDVFNLIEYCPADIIASHRSLVMKIEAVQLTEEGPSPQVGDHIMIFIFTDVVLFAKKKSKVVAMTTKPCEELTDKILKLAHGKPYKHLQVVSHTSIRRILNVVDNQSVRNVFVLVTRGQDELRESHIPFRLLEGLGDKMVLLETWCRAVASHTCTTDPNSYLMTMSADQCGLSSSDVEETQKQKASRMMAKTQYLLGSVFKGGLTIRGNKLRTNTFSVHGFASPSVRSPSCSDLTDEQVVDEKTHELKTASLTHNLVTKM